MPIRPAWTEYNFVLHMNRYHQILLIGSIVALAWLWMQVVHELGHCLGAWATGGTVEKVVLHPLAISRTDLARSPQPLVVVWAGPLFGVLLPVMIWVVLVIAHGRLTWPPRFFAGFCLLANGIYIGIGSFEGIGDAGDMLRHGSPIWTLWHFGLTTAPAGLWLWNGLGPHFGFGANPPPIDRGVGISSLVALLATIVVECLL